MEIVQIVGYREVDFTDERGKQIVGRSYYYINGQDGVIGKGIGKLWIPRERIDSFEFLPMPGDVVKVSCGFGGRVNGFELYDA